MKGKLKQLKACSLVQSSCSGLKHFPVLKPREKGRCHKIRAWATARWRVAGGERGLAGLCHQHVAFTNICQGYLRSVPVVWLYGSWLCWSAAVPEAGRALSVLCWEGCMTCWHPCHQGAGTQPRHIFVKLLQLVLLSSFSTTRRIWRFLFIAPLPLKSGVFCLKAGCQPARGFSFPPPIQTAVSLRK